jgi:Fic-DOC domain mobile mystery protein B
LGVKFEYPAGVTPLDPDEAVGLIPALSTQAELNDFEALNIAEAVLWASRSRKVRRSILDRVLLSELHGRMFGNTWHWAGSYRLTAKNIGVEAWRIPVEVENLVGDCASWVECESYPKLEIAARFHHRLVSIHPFPNGNGRHARLATDLLCRQMAFAIPTWGSASLSGRTEVRDQYLNALRAADRHDIRPLVEFLVS